MPYTYSPDRTRPMWHERYLGVPYARDGRDLTGLDCQGLVRLVLADRAGVVWGEVASPADGAGRAGLILVERFRWARVAGPDGALGDDLRPLDVALFRMMGWLSHCGVVVGPEGVLHVLDRAGVILSPFSRRPWFPASPGDTARIEGFYRHPALCPTPSS